MEIPPGGRSLVEMLDELFRTAGINDWPYLQKPSRPAETYDQPVRGALLAVAPLLEELEHETVVAITLDAETYKPVLVPSAFWRNEIWRVRRNRPAIGKRVRKRVEPAHGRGPNAYTRETVWLYVEPRLMRPAETAVEAMARAWRKLSDNQTINTSMSYEQQHGFVLDELGRNRRREVTVTSTFGGT